jgi:hypothetical protein
MIFPCGLSGCPSVTDAVAEKPSPFISFNPFNDDPIKNRHGEK